MARSLRIQFSGSSDHVMARGSRREAIFHDDDDWRDKDRRFFLHKEGLTAVGLQAMDLPGLKGSELRKAVLARQTTVSQAWVGDHRHLHSASNESQKVRRWAARREKRQSLLLKALEASIRVTDENSQSSNLSIFSA